MSASTPAARENSPRYSAAAMPLRPAPNCKRRSKRSKEPGSCPRHGERLRDLLKRRQRLATLRMRRQRRPAFGVEHARMRVTRKTNDAGHRDVGVADFVTEPVSGFARGAVAFEHVENARDLDFAALHPDVRFLPVQQTLVDKAHRLVAKPGRQRADFEGF